MEWSGKDILTRLHFLKKLFILLCWVLVVAGGLLSCGIRTLSCGMCVGSSALTRDQTPGPLHWECGVLTTELPGKSLDKITFEQRLKACKGMAFQAEKWEVQRS